MGAPQACPMHVNSIQEGSMEFPSIQVHFDKRLRLHLNDFS